MSQIEEKGKKLPQEEGAFRDTTGRFGKDQYLRRRGWRIVCRPKGGPAVWTDGKRHLTFEEALRLTGY